MIGPAGLVLARRGKSRTRCAAAVAFLRIVESVKRGFELIPRKGEFAHCGTR